MPVRSQRHVREVRGIGSTSYFPGATLEMLFAGNVYKGASPSQLTFARTGVAHADDNKGTWFSFASNAARITDRGLRMEQNFQNSIRNSSMQGVVPGTPGTLPTNWAQFNPAGTFTRTILGTGIDAGMEYIDVRFQGTCSGPGSFTFRPDVIGQMLASVGQTWMGSMFVKLLADNGPKLISDLRLTTISLDATPAQNGAFDGPNLRSQLNAGIWVRTSAPLTMPASTVSTIIQLNTATTVFANGDVVDFTIRLGWPNLGQYIGGLTSPVRTINAAVTRNLESCSLLSTAFSSWYTGGTSGTLFWQGRMLFTGPNNQFMFGVSAGNNTDEIFIYLNASGVFIGRAAVGGVDQFSIGTIAHVAGNRFKVALAYSPAGATLYVNGVQSGNFAAGISLPTVNQCNIGGRGDGSFRSNFLTERVSYIPSRYSAAQLQQITTP